jgi:Ni/Co efflux regulator RcnB
MKTLLLSLLAASTLATAARAADDHPGARDNRPRAGDRDRNDNRNDNQRHDRNDDRGRDRNDRDHRAPGHK